MTQTNKTNFEHLKIKMIETIKTYGLTNQTILNAMLKIPRHEFVPDELKDQAYEDSPLSIGYYQTISQPYTVAFMLDLLELKKGNNVLEIGCGSGYNAAIIKEIVGKEKEVNGQVKGRVISIEVVKELIEFAKNNLSKTGYDDIKIISDDGSLGSKQFAPYDKIIATCACPRIPKPWIEQLTETGVIVAPIGSLFSQEMIQAKKIDGELVAKSFGSFRFVPLIGKYGFKK
ncbi:protein-L-isoaspartate(D-aspartate) O-methyltransferase [Candidatus Woesearchaeota archaeon]|nr:protein-L-isoaspartate(D-aspartate) O-methyltransferase [Candidatus Woesearchaeota archaeon]